jgi:hypothetical protein
MPTDPLVTFASSAEAMRKFAASIMNMSTSMNMATAIWTTAEPSPSLRRCECKCTSCYAASDKGPMSESDVSLKTKRQINADTAASIARLEVQPEHD